MSSALTPVRRSARKVARFFDQDGLRWVIALLYPLASRFSPHGVRAMQFDDGWVHRFDEGFIVENAPRLRGAELSEQRIGRYSGQLYVPRQGDTVIDVGAGYGWETLHYSRMVGNSGRILSIEAHPLLAAMLKRTTELNQLGNVDVLNLALAEKRQTIFIENDLANHRGNALKTEAEAGELEVQAVTLDELCSERKIASVSFIKMNIEGAEQLALQGMKETLAKTGVIAVSCHDFKFERTGNPFFRTKAKVEAFLTEAGFTIVSRPDMREPWLRDQVNAYNPARVRRSKLNPAAFEADRKAS